MDNRLSRWWHDNAPTRESLEHNRFLAPVAHRVLEPSLWRFTRRSVPRGVALGLLVGIFLLIPGVQIAGAALLALPFRANIPVAAAMTFLSNPATTPLILWLSVYIGNWMLGRSADASGFMTLVDHHATIGQWAAWLVSEAAPALLLGLSIISIVAAAIGYVIADWVWRHRMGRKWKARKLRIGKAHKSSALEKPAPVL
ncbi:MULTISPECIES: DUF2062 domain-containing protein [unclassified Sphingobium]|uniref:DUF2062 domain-containing protein n=1 Tax=unclassified Sphingobium TaxID=2611147 RepID=UPI000D177942|nr:MULTISPECIES: DUF2062 domain-containing protein [unclassified Sphingobium]MBG6117727.1 uncharacterized protein (DUF2062 family) [Sphingobium sp. JAI105]PSO12427.1 DUF2062 domain-containing protein [Sphingobium sp. AEW4]TWD08371.1 hypothetical protein FB595_10510 [Sphingobium sp. AEW010]TWD25998.1 hypothetical protein FB596_105273 [Sphingobium sp. AEW013]TWD28167.1 hypothetical protein FB594_10410 [Sphingobium sp. AEW001]